MTQWTETDGIHKAEFPDLGTVIIYPEDGWTVNINGQRAWSSWHAHSTWRGNLETVKLDIQNMVRHWAYLNQFRSPKSP